MLRPSPPLTLGKSRIEALSDGVFSIAMTLLVLKLEVPEVMHHSSNEAMLRQLLALGPALVTYVVTFLVAGGFGSCITSRFTASGTWTESWCG